MYNRDMKNNGITKYFEEVELTEEYDGYFCNVADTTEELLHHARWKCIGFSMFILKKIDIELKIRLYSKAAVNLVNQFKSRNNSNQLILILYFNTCLTLIRF